MKKSTKGALAASAAGALLLGGAGSLAFWSDDATVDGGSISSGSITLSSVVCDTTWGHTEDAGAPVTYIVPGDTISKECTGTLTLVGDHIGATVELDSDSLDAVAGDLGSELEASATLVDPTGGAVTTAGAHDITVRIDVTFPDTVTSVTSQTATATLDALELTATQTHE